MRKLYLVFSQSQIFYKVRLRPGGYSDPEVTLAPKQLKFTKNLKPYNWLYSTYYVYFTVFYLYV